MIPGTEVKMSELTEILDSVNRGDTEASEALLPLAYRELRAIAANKMARERQGHTLQPTALVHEAYLRLLGPDGEERTWDNKGHFFAAAAEAMRRILIDSARKKMRQKRGGDVKHTTYHESQLVFATPDEEVLEVDRALKKLEDRHPDFARVVKLRYFAGLTIPETASVLEVSESTVQRTWASARAWLSREISEEGGKGLGL